MKPLVFNKDSWHHQLAVEWGGMAKWEDESNICRYTRAVLSGLAKVGLLLAMVGALIYWITITIVWWVVLAMHGYVEAEGPIVLTFLIALVLISWVIGDVIPKQFKKLREKRKVKRHQAGLPSLPTPDSFITKAWRAWKDKTCVRVVIVDTKDAH